MTFLQLPGRHWMVHILERNCSRTVYRCEKLMIASPEHIQRTWCYWMLRKPNNMFSKCFKMFLPVFFLLFVLILSVWKVLQQVFGEVHQCTSIMYNMKTPYSIKLHIFANSISMLDLESYDPNIVWRLCIYEIVL